ncbi:receptor-like protein kinase HSL1 [Salvia hispanica]|uniref:receptor-like protein kinase HSL1 n=1 Tax=Salvia hispanica TaxID=49212 RepID=UPI0020097B91|nr:receptor-like protein kinase HSL1 [Salvia hispanica]
MHHLNRRFHLLLILIVSLAPSLSLTLSLNKEVLYLQKAKLNFDDPNAALSNWNPHDETPCKWNGVVCDSSSSVVSLDLSSSSLSGPFPSVLCRLHRLSSISFYDNFINSTLPDDDLADCLALQHLDLAQNYLTGALPRRISELTRLRYLDLSGNNFSGGIPASYGTFQKLEVLALVENLLEGVIPSFLGNVTTLKMLNLSYNPFSPGRIPPEIGNLTNLEVLWLTQTSLTGEIPDSLGRLGRLVDLDLAYNELSGSIPPSLTQLRALVQLELYNNSLSGKLPSGGWSNMTGLRRLDASTNELTGRIPVELCELPLESFNLYENNLHGGLPDVIAESPNLYELKLFRNRLSGELPSDLGRNSALWWIDVSTNNFSGRIPESLCYNGALEELLLIENSFSGEIPASLGECRSLLRVRLGHNNLSGDVPAGFWGLPHVSLLELIGNSFSGGIAKTIAGASNLSQLILSENKFSGNLPEEIAFLENLLEISGNDNEFSGTLPVSVVNLRQLVKLDLHNNAFSGGFPIGIDSWKKLNELNLADNQFHGEIPGKIGELSVLNYLDLSRNKFSGEIPVSLQNLKLNRFNFSYNNLSGHIPSDYAKAMYKDSFIGNPGLCGEIQGLCNSEDIKNKGYIWFIKTLFVLVGILLIFGVVWFYIKYKKFNDVKTNLESSKWTLMSFHKLGFSESEILEALDEDSVIGTGASGKVYKVVLSNGEAVAVKRLWGPSKAGDDIERGSIRDDGFDAEVETLGKIRHKNIVKLWCCCTTRDSKLLVYEYMPNGSLGDLLHSTKSGLLDWPIRFKIAVDAAEGLSYLHHDCVPPIVHRDVKSNNILLDSEYGARVADFGLAKVVDVASGKGTKSMSVIAGSCGYIAPEYAYTLRVNEKSDVYSFGVVILELVTGRLPVDPEFGEKDLVNWVCWMLDQKGVLSVIDPKLNSGYTDDICRLLNLGLLCTSLLPTKRPSMRHVVQMMQEIGCRSLHKNVVKQVN